MKLKFNRRAVLTGMAALPACKPSNSKFDADVIILGAGLAGLNAARILSAEGKDVLVLEGSDRVGGRLHTIEHADHGYTEAGGEQIGANYARLIDTARDLNVSLNPDRPTGRVTGYYFEDQNYISDAIKGLNPFRFAPPFKGSHPAFPLYALAGKANPLTAADDWLDPRYIKHDISAQEFLTNSGLGTEAQNIIEHSLNGNELESYSMMNLYRTLYLYSQSRGMGYSLSVKGGAQRLPEAMGNSLDRKIKTNQLVRTITTHTDSVTIQTSNGKTYRAAKCICALPFGALRHIRIDAPILRLQKQAINQLPYTQIFQIHMKAKLRFWEKDGLPPDIWTDLPVERIFANRDDKGEPNGLFRIWINGRGAQRPIWTDHKKIAEHVSAQMKKVRPASEGKFDILHIANWTQSNTLAGGAYMHWAPGQIAKWANIMKTPTQNLSFAGEHLSRLHTGMEGAMESGENAAFHLLGI